MKNLLPYFDRISEKSVSWILLLCSVAVASRLIYIQHGWISDDSVLYFEIARLFTIGEWQQGFALYGWPLYPALIALIHKISGAGIQSSAQILTVVLFVLTTLSFCRLIRLAGGNTFTVFCAAFLLFGSPYIVGDVLPMQLRDHGFWAFLLTSLVFFVQFYREGKLSDALLWQACAIIAMLFRLEAISYLVLLPLACLMITSLDKRSRTLRMLQAYALSLSSAGALTIALLTIPSLTVADLGRIQEIVGLFETNYLQITQNIATKAQLMGEILGDHLDDFGMHAILLTLAIIIPIKTVQAASWWTVALLAIKPKNAAAAPASDAKHIFYWVAVIALINACLIITSTFVLTSRYVIVLGFMLMLLAAFNMSALFDNGQSRARKRLGVALLIILSLSLIKNVWPKDGSYYNYEQDAVAWIQENTPVDSKVFYASPRSRFYAGVAYSGRAYPSEAIATAIADGSVYSYDYLVLNMQAKHAEQNEALEKQLVRYQPVKEFPGFRNTKKIVIYAKR